MKVRLRDSNVLEIWDMAAADRVRLIVSVQWPSVGSVGTAGAGAVEVEATGAGVGLAERDDCAETGVG